MSRLISQHPPVKAAKQVTTPDDKFRRAEGRHQTVVLTPSDQRLIKNDFKFKPFIRSYSIYTSEVGHFCHFWASAECLESSVGEVTFIPSMTGAESRSVSEWDALFRDAFSASCLILLAASSNSPSSWGQKSSTKTRTKPQTKLIPAETRQTSSIKLSTV